MKKFVAAISVLTIISTLVFNSHIGSSNNSRRSRRSNNNVHHSNSFKYSFPKDGKFPKQLGFAEMSKKLSNLELDIKAEKTDGNRKLHTLDKRVSDIQQDFILQGDILIDLESEVMSMQKAMNEHDNTFNDLENYADGGKAYYTVSNNSCGQSLTSEMGYLRFEKRQNEIHSHYCIWTIRGSGRKYIKINSHSIYRNDSRKTEVETAHVYEVPTGGRSASNSLRATRIVPGKHQVFDGPVIFVVLQVKPEDNNDIHFHMEFETFGSKPKERIHFTNGVIPPCVDSCVFDSASIFNSLSFKKTTAYSNEVVTIVSNFTSKVFFRIQFDRNQCTDYDTFRLYPMSNDEPGLDCCASDCNVTFVTQSKPIIIVIEKQFSLVPYEFKIPMKIEPVYPSSYKFEGSNCGGVLGGTSGQLEYKMGINYNNNERCVWTIVPQPVMRSAIKITVDISGIEEAYDMLYMVEINDINGTSTDLKTTILHPFESYVTHSRQVHIVFYSDDHITGTGFSIFYQIEGEIVTTGSSVFNSFDHYDGIAGDAIVELNPLTSTYQVISITPTLEANAYDNIFKIKFRLTNQQVGDNCWDSSNLHVYTIENGKLVENSLSCVNSVSTVTTRDRFVLAAISFGVSNTLNKSMEIQWETEPVRSVENNLVVTNETRCGGVIHSDSGRIQYYPSEQYSNNERCIWTVLSSQSSITFTLNRDGFEACCDYLMVTGFEEQNANFMGNWTKINRKNRTMTVSSPALVMFASDAGTQGTGFLLDFNSLQATLQSNHTTFSAVHRSESVGRYSSKEDLFATDSDQHGSHISIFSYSVSPVEGNPQNILTDFHYGVFNSHQNNCEYEYIVTYTFDIPETPNVAQTPTLDVMQQCHDIIPVGRNNPWLDTDFGAFIVIKKSFSHSTGVSAFGWRQANTCGGVMVGEFGYISYKELDKYDGYEECIWLIEVPGASQIRFVLEKYGFETCCDYVMVAPIDSVEGSIGNVTALGTTEKSDEVPLVSTIINGPLAVVVFKSDGNQQGEGFRIQFMMMKTTESTSKLVSPYRHRLVYENVKMQRYSYKIEQNEMLITAFTGSGQDLQTRSVAINVNSFHPELTSTCDSDMLTFYNFPVNTSDGFTVEKRLKAVDVLGYDPQNDSHESHEIESEYHSHSHEQKRCGDESNERIITETDAQIGEFNTTSRSFIAIYKSVQNTTMNLTQRGYSVDLNMTMAVESQRDLIESEVSFTRDANHRGGTLTIMLSTQKCFNFPPGWDNTVSSVNTHGQCLILWEDKECSGSSLVLTPTSPSHNFLGTLHFNDMASSAKLTRCANKLTVSSIDYNDD